MNEAYKAIVKQREAYQIWALREDLSQMFVVGFLASVALVGVAGFTYFGLAPTGIWCGMSALFAATLLLLWLLGDRVFTPGRCERLWGFKP